MSRARVHGALFGGLLLGLCLTAPALAQDDDPWAQPADEDSGDEDTSSEDSSDDDSSDDSSDDEGPVELPTLGEPTEGEAAPPAADPFAPPGFEEGEDGSDGEAADVQAPSGTPTATVRRDPDDLARGNVPQGLRIQPYGAGTGIAVSQAFVLGANGGTNQTLATARYRIKRWGIQVGLPFVAYRLPRQDPPFQRQRDTGLGNLQLDAWYDLQTTETGYTGIGLELHTNIGARAYTWVHEADDIWPGTGADLAIQSRRTSGRITRMGRAAIGVRGGRDYAPWASSYLTIELAAGADVALGERFGIVGEASFAYWDLSPFDLTGFLRADLSDGLRVRGGIVAPFAVWIGATRMDEDYRGFREITAVMDISLAL